MNEIEITFSKGERSVHEHIRTQVQQTYGPDWHLLSLARYDGIGDERPWWVGMATNGQQMCEVLCVPCLMPYPEMRQPTYRIQEQRAGAPGGVQHGA
jgi:hypothetical protein